MTVTEFAIIRFHSSPDFSSSEIHHSLLHSVSDWQSTASGFPVYFFTDGRDPHLVHLVSGWTSVEAHEAWIRGERNQELLKAFTPHIDMAGVRMVHVNVEFEKVPTGDGLVVERYHLEQEGDLVGRDLGESGDVYRFVGGAEGLECDEAAPVERWELKRVHL